MSQAGLDELTLALIIPFMAPAIGIFLMRQFIGTIPSALIQAARIDGASGSILLAGDFAAGASCAGSAGDFVVSGDVEQLGLAPVGATRSSEYDASGGHVEHRRQRDGGQRTAARRVDGSRDSGDDPDHHGLHRHAEAVHRRADRRQCQGITFIEEHKPSIHRDLW